jgi:ABC-type transport system involved in multi-copper enzyme maturation permease subunit
MWHGILTLMARSLRLEARLLRTHLFRLVFVSIIYLMMSVALVQSLWVGAPGLDFLGQMLFLNTAFITLGGVSFFASAITEEKEENTLGLLMMTGLSPVGILFGKSTARMLQALLLLAVQFPFTLLAITLGGVLIHQVLAAYLALLAYTVWLSNLALFWSVVCKRTGSAAGATVLTVMGYSATPYLAAEGLRRIAILPWGGTALGQACTSVLAVLNEISVFQRLQDVTQTGFNDPLLGVQVISNLAAGLVCFLAAWGLFDRFALHADTGASERSVVVRAVERVRWLAPRRAWANPLIWKDYFFLTGGHAAAVLKTGILLLLYPALLTYFHWINQTQTVFSDNSWPLSLGVHMAIAGALVGLEASIYASRVFHDEIRWQTMSALLTLPRSIAYVAYSKIAGCLLALLPGLAFLLLDASLLPFAPGEVLKLVLHPGFGLTVLVISIFLHLVVLLSLFLKWGALPVAFMLTLMGLYCGMCAFLVPWFATVERSEFELIIRVVGWILLLLVLGGSSLLFQMMIHARLQELGSK